MLRKIFLFFLLSFMAILFWGCASKKNMIKTGLERYFDKDFEGLQVPDAGEIRRLGESRSFPHTSFDMVWDSAIIVLMQEGIIARASKDTGIILTISKSSSAIFVDKEGEAITVYLKRMHNLDWNGGQGGTFLDELATQIYADQKWSYLSLSPPHRSPNISSKLSSKELSTGTRRSIDMRLKAGWAFFENGNYSKAREIFNQILQTDPSNADALEAITKTEKAEMAERAIGELK